MNIECMTFMYGPKGEKGGCWQRKIVYPFPPHPGMGVGNFTVKRVDVCQGDLDGQGYITVWLKKTTYDGTNPQILESQGWKWTT